MFSVNTQELNSKLNLLSKVCSNNAVMPITSCINIKSRINMLELITTDGSVNIYAYLKNENLQDDINIFINMALLQGVVKFCKTEEIIFDINTKNVKITSGNGEYILPIMNNIDGVKISPINLDVVGAEEIKTNSNLFSEIYKYNKFFLDDLNLNNATHNYYLGTNKCISSDGYMMCKHKIDFNIKDGIVLDRKLVDILKDCNDDIYWYHKKEYDLFMCKNSGIHIYTNTNKQTYPIEVLEKYLDNVESENNFTIGIATLENILNKMSLFVSPLRNNAINFNVGDKTIISECISNNAKEELELKHNGKFMFTINGKELLSIILKIDTTEITDDLITINYIKNYNTSYIGIKTINTTYIFACLNVEDKVNE